MIKILLFLTSRQSNTFDLQGLSAEVVTSFAKVDDAGIYVEQTAGTEFL
jgi:hypothetical protein